MKTVAEPYLRRWLPALAAGALAAVPLTVWWQLVGAGAGAAGGAGVWPALAAAARAALPEETAKLTALAALLAAGRASNRRASLGLRASVEVGLALGLGFAAAEGGLYALHGGWETTLVRAFTAVPCHAFLGAVMAHYLARFRAGCGWRWLAKAWVVPVLLHGLYDVPLMLGGLATAIDPARDAAQDLVLASLVLLLLAAWTRRLLAHGGGASVGTGALPPA